MGTFDTLYINQWFYFSAKFTDGRLVGIKRTDEDSSLYW